VDYPLTNVLIDALPEESRRLRLNLSSSTVPASSRIRMESAP
jgi:hypothetical protein